MRSPLNLVAGELVPSLEGADQPISNPASEELLATVPLCGPDDVDRAVRAAKDAFPGWRDLTPGARSRLLLELSDALEAGIDGLVALESANVGKPIKAAGDEAAIAVDTLRYFAGVARAPSGVAAGEYLDQRTSLVRREPIGVAGLIVPWNYPLVTMMMKLAPALAAGNTAILKPSQLTPLSALLVAELAAAVLPAGVLNVITGPGAVLGDALVRHPDVRIVSLTGDTSTGRAVAAAGASTLTRLILELGGKAPMLVLDDADPSAVAAGIITGGYYNAGQDCTAACRVLIAEQIYEPVLERLVPALTALRVGNPTNGEDVELGPVISDAHRERVLGFVERASANSAHLLTGGRALDRPGYFIEPTVLTGVDQGDEIVQREVFGPVVTIQRSESDAQGLMLANDVRYGLAASVWTQSLNRAHWAARQLEFGTVWINDHLPFVPEMPFSGFRDSGYGAEMSPYGLAQYTRLKHVMARTGSLSE